MEKFSCRVTQEIMSCFWAEAKQEMLKSGEIFTWRGSAKVIFENAVFVLPPSRSCDLWPLSHTNAQIFSVWIFGHHLLIKTRIPLRLPLPLSLSLTRAAHTQLQSFHSPVQVFPGQLGVCMSERAGRHTSLTSKNPASLFLSVELRPESASYHQCFLIAVWPTAVKLRCVSLRCSSVIFKSPGSI